MLTKVGVATKSMTTYSPAPSWLCCKQDEVTQNKNMTLPNDTKTFISRRAKYIFLIGSLSDLWLLLN